MSPSSSLDPTRACTPGAVDRGLDLAAVSVDASVAKESGSVARFAIADHGPGD
jgi:hypothetical protein